MKMDNYYGLLKCFTPSGKSMGSGSIIKFRKDPRNQNMLLFDSILFADRCITYGIIKIRDNKIISGSTSHPFYIKINTLLTSIQKDTYIEDTILNHSGDIEFSYTCLVYTEKDDNSAILLKEIGGL